MNEAEFIIRRIIKESESWIASDYQRKKELGIRPLVAELHKDGQKALLNHLIETFTEGKQNESRND